MMKQFLMIPDVNRLPESIALAEEYGLSFEYNDFYTPEVLDDEDRLRELIAAYGTYPAPGFCTLHGAFFDVIPTSPDQRIRAVAALRIRQSIEAARRMGASAVVFHTNHNPFLNSAAYIERWIDDNTAFWSRVLRENPDISVRLENMFDLSPDLLLALSERLSEHKNYGVCLDFAHAALSNTAPETWAKTLGRFVRHVHINDNDLKSDLHLPWGGGSIDRKAFYRCYEDYLGGATVLIETASMENTRRSLEVLATDGFLTR